MLTDAQQMARALALAERGRGRTSPNPMVGAIVVDDEGVIVGRGSHEVAGGPHAEAHALNDAGRRARGATLYCTLEPCCHFGRTPPCAPRIAEAGIRRAVVAIEDPNPLVAGQGIAQLQARGVDVSVGVGREAAAALNRPFFTVMQQGRPHVTVKVALTLDARVTAARDTRTMLTGEAVNRLVHRERAEVDAIGVGSETILVDDPLLTARGIYRHRPLTRVIFDGRLRTPPAARVFSTLEAGPVIIVTSEPAVCGNPGAADALRSAGAELHIHDAADGHSVSLAASLARLAESGICSIVIEGGPTLHQGVCEKGLVDRVQIFVTPRAVGAGGIPWVSADSLRLTDLVDMKTVPVGDDVMIEGHVHRPH